jgi:hypothetical protein
MLCRVPSAPTPLPGIPRDRIWRFDRLTTCVRYHVVAQSLWRYRNRRYRGRGPTTPARRHRRQPCDRGRRRSLTGSRSSATHTGRATPVLGARVMSTGFSRAVRVVCSSSLPQPSHKGPYQRDDDALGQYIDPAMARARPAFTSPAMWDAFVGRTRDRERWLTARGIEEFVGRSPGPTSRARAAPRSGVLRYPRWRRIGRKRIAALRRSAPSP